MDIGLDIECSAKPLRSVEQEVVHAIPQSSERGAVGIYSSRPNTQAVQRTVQARPLKRRSVSDRGEISTRQNASTGELRAWTIAQRMMPGCVTAIVWPAPDWLSS